MFDYQICSEKNMVNTSYLKHAFYINNLGRFSFWKFLLLFWVPGIFLD